VVDLATAPERAVGPEHSVLPGAVVRGLVARYEQEIAALALELESALAEAAEAERSADGCSLAEVVALGSPGGIPTAPEPIAHLATVASTLLPLAVGPSPAAPPRTTVVTRPRSRPPDASSAPSSALVPPAPSPAGKASGVHRSGDSWSSRWKARWMMKAGVVFALAGILLLKFG
jgi:hypothetical protein